MKKYLLVFSALLCGGFVAAAQEYPQWVSDVQAASRQAQLGQLPANWYGLRLAREDAYIDLCYQHFMDSQSPFVQQVKTAMPEKAPSYLRWAYTLLKGRREWLQLDVHNGKLFAPYAVMASRPLDLVEMSEESFLKLRHILQGDFPNEGILFAPRTERQGNTVLVWFENWTPQDKVIRLAFNTDVYVLDICRNECEENPFL